MILLVIMILCVYRRHLYKPRQRNGKKRFCDPNMYIKILNLLIHKEKRTNNFIEESGKYKILRNLIFLNVLETTFFLLTRVTTYFRRI